MLAIFVLASCSFWSYCPDYQSCILFIRILPTISLLGNFPFAPNVLFWAQLLLGHVVYVVVKISLVFPPLVLCTAVGRRVFLPLHSTPYTFHQKIASIGDFSCTIQNNSLPLHRNKENCNGYTKDQY